MGRMMGPRDQKCPRGRRSREVRKDQLWTSGEIGRKIKRKHVNGLNAPSLSVSKVGLLVSDQSNREQQGL